MPRDVSKSKKQAAKRAKEASSQPASSSARKKSSGPPKKRGNQGNFHGKALDFLESRFSAYAAASGKKKPFWDDFFPTWDQKFPLLALKGTPASEKPLNGLVDGYGSEGEESEHEDPHVHFARTVSRAVGFFCQNFIHSHT